MFIQFKCPSLWSSGSLKEQNHFQVVGSIMGNILPINRPINITIKYNNDVITDIIIHNNDVISD